jgi:hypothetical protein
MLARKLTKGLCIAALGLLLARPQLVQAAPIQAQIEFSTVGSVDSFNVSGTPVVSFQGTSGIITSSSVPFSLGNFMITSPPPGTTTTYNNIPFQILYKTEAVNGVAPSPNETPVVLTGFFNGTVTAGSSGTVLHPDLTVTFNSPKLTTTGTMPPFPINVMPFQTGNLINYLGISNPGDNGQPILANLGTESNVPEPSSIAIGACLAGLGLWQSRRLARASRPSN